MFEYAIYVLQSQINAYQQGIDFNLIKYSQHDKQYWQDKITELEKAIQVLKENDK